MKSTQQAVPGGLDLVFTGLCLHLGSILVGIASGLILFLFAPDYGRRDTSSDVALPTGITVMLAISGVISLTGLLLELVGKVKCLSSPRAAGGKVPLILSLVASNIAVFLVPASVFVLATAPRGLSATVAGSAGAGVVFVAALFFCWYARSLARYFRPELTGRATIAVVLFGFALVCMIACVVSEVKAKIDAAKPQVQVPNDAPASSEGMDQPEFAAPPPEQAPQPGLLSQVGNTWIGAGGIGMLVYMWLLRDLRGAKRRQS